MHDFLERARKLGEEKFRPFFRRRLNSLRAATVNLSLVDIVRRDPHGPHRKESKNVNVISTGRTVISRSISLVLELEEEYEQDM